ncbi:glycosyltransferase family 4 protein [Lichenicoccus sp.]|uniref:glycosyltransferase family 4 protein n=1 Tax=Lichenicoccus sp. TaxID=2781899 RepID=UPI003D11D752
MAAGQIRTGRLTVDGPVAVVLPPREGFSPGAVGAIGLLVHRLSPQEDCIVGAPLAAPAFAGRRFVAARPVPWPPLGPLRYAAAVASVLRRLRPALIEVHNRPEIARHLAWRFPDIPVALILHNDPQAMRRARTASERTALLRRMRVACVSDWLRGRFVEGLPTGTEVRVLPNCIDLAALPPPVREREKLILFAGRVVADKGADAFVAACARVLPHRPGWRAAIIGGDRFSADAADTAFLAALRPLAAAAGIVMHGHQPHRVVLEAMARAAIVVVPSRWQEPFGMTALEAMACGAALIVSPRPGLLEVVGHAALRAEPDLLEAALLRLTGDPALQAGLSGRGLARAQLFDIAPARRRLQAMRADALARSRGFGQAAPA